MNHRRLSLSAFLVLGACTTVVGPPGGGGVDVAVSPEAGADASPAGDADVASTPTGPDGAPAVDATTGDVASDEAATGDHGVSSDTSDSGGPDSGDVVATACDHNDDCLGDTHCVTGQCVPYADGEVDDACAKSVTPGVFFPALQCEWIGPPAGDPFPDHRNVLGSPTVVSLPFALSSGGGAPGDGGQIVFVSYALSDGGLDSGNCCGVIRVIDGSTCQQLWTLDAHLVVGGSNLAIGDLNLDGTPEIVALAEGGGLVAFAYDPISQQFAQLWHSTEPDGVTLDTFGDGINRWNGPSLADITGDGHPEVLYEGSLYDHDGVKIGPGLGWLSYQQGMFPVAADVDLDGLPEIMLGAAAHRFDATTMTYVQEPYVTTPPGSGHIALADFGDYMPGMPPDVAEVVMVSAGSVTVQALDGSIIFGPYTLPGGGNGGPPTVADFDGDGEPEFASAGLTRYTVFDPGCVGSPLPADCESEGVLWSKLSQDQSSNKTGSSVFDFEADGIAEAVYGDECFVRTYDGTNGDVLYSGPRSSCTWHEQPVIADVDGDFRTEIVIGSNDNCGVSCPTLDPIHGGLRCDDSAGCVSGSCVAGLCRCTQASECVAGYACAAMLPAEEDGQGQVCRAEHSGKLRGIRVYRDAKDSWAQSRRIWNQHAYYVTNIDEDGRVPPVGEVVTNWTQSGLNDFRRNSQGSLPAQGASDLTVKAADEALDCGDGIFTLTAEVCNRGVVPVGSGVSVAFYAQQPAPGASPVCTEETTEPLVPGQCAELACDADSFLLPDGGFWASVDGAGEYLECNEGNNLGASDYEGCQ